MSRTGYPFLQRNRKLERDKRDEEIEFLRRQLAVIGNVGGKGMSFNTGYGEDNRLQPDMPTHMLQTNAGPRTIHEGEDVDVGEDGQFSVTPAEQSGGMQSAIPGFRNGTRTNSQNYIDITKKSVNDSIMPASQFGGQRGLRRTEATGRIPGFQTGTFAPTTPTGFGGLDSLSKQIAAAKSTLTTPTTTASPFSTSGITSAAQNIVNTQLPIPSINTSNVAAPPTTKPTATATPIPDYAGMTPPPPAVGSNTGASQYYGTGIYENQPGTMTGNLAASNSNEMITQANQNLAALKTTANTLGITDQMDLGQITKTFDQFKAMGKPLPQELITMYSRAGGKTYDLVNTYGYSPTNQTWLQQVTEGPAQAQPGPATPGGAPVPPEPIIPGAETPTGTPSESQYSPFVNRALQRLERYAEGQDPFAAKIRESEAERFKGEESAARGAMAQELAQAGISGREALTAQARQSRQIGADFAGLMGDLRQAESDRAFQAATALPGQALAADAQNLAKDYFNLAKDKEDYSRMGDAFNAMVQAKDWPNASKMFGEMFPDSGIDFTKMTTVEQQTQFLEGMDTVSSLIASGITTWDAALPTLQQSGTLTNLGLSEDAAKGVFEQMVLGTDPVYRAMNSFDDATLKTMFPDMTPTEARAAVGKLHTFGALTFDETGKMTWDMDLLESMGLYKPGTGTTAVQFGVYDKDGKLISPPYTTEAEANTWKFNHPEMDGLSVRTAGTTTGTTGTTTATGTTTGTGATGTTGTTGSEGGEIPTTSLNVADKIGELSGQKTGLLDEGGNIPFVTETGIPDYQTMLAYVKVDDADQQQYAAAPMPESSKTAIEGVIKGTAPTLDRSTTDGRYPGSAEIYNWFNSNKGKYVNIDGQYYVITAPSHVGSSGSLFNATHPEDTINLYSLNGGKTVSLTYRVGNNEWAV